MSPVNGETPSSLGEVSSTQRELIELSTTDLYNNKSLGETCRERDFLNVYNLCTSIHDRGENKCGDYADTEESSSPLFEIDLS